MSKSRQPRKQSKQPRGTSNSSSPDPLTLADTTATTAASRIRLELDRDNPAALTVYVNDVPSSYIDTANPANLGFEYLEVFRDIIEDRAPLAERFTHLGAAACGFARAISASRPTSTHIAIDIDGELMAHARTWFALPRAPRLRLRTADAFAGLRALSDKSADVIIRDVFAGATTPSALTTDEFYRTAIGKLRAGGLVLMNIGDRPPLTQTKREAATLLREIGPHAWVGVAAETGVLKGRRYGNVVLAGQLDSGNDPAAPALSRTLRSHAQSVSLLTGSVLTDFIAGAQPIDAPAIHAVPATP
ncbi:spermidine synthase [Rarobacter incanus]|uniref:Spermidine synthase n=1 Tax=Rarobacter incanus TaxID=153494 RepID=A0A542SLI4_9MICO|nr:fused MFS/spermidine synthase [Rarobacter incanus]TQK75483.1 hypothetical protein FB389_0110 [Rarobacter incanus]